MRVAIKKGKEYSPLDGFIPNPKLKLLEQVSEVMRFKHYSIRTWRRGQFAVFSQTSMKSRGLTPSLACSSSYH